MSISRGKRSSLPQTRRGLTLLSQLCRDPEFRGSESETERKPEVPASPRDEAVFHCAKPSGVPRVPANSTASLTYQRHHEDMLGEPPVGLGPWNHTVFTHNCLLT